MSFLAMGKGTLTAAICEGFSWGNDPTGHKHTRKAVKLTDDWRKITIEHVVRERPVEAVVGFDYHQAGSVARLCQAVVEKAPAL